MAEVGTAENVLEQLAARRSDVARAAGRYLENSEFIVRWIFAGRPSSEEDIALLGPCALLASNAALELEVLLGDLGSAIRAAQTPVLPIIEPAGPRVLS